MADTIQIITIAAGGGAAGGGIAAVILRALFNTKLELLKSEWAKQLEQYKAEWAKQLERYKAQSGTVVIKSNRFAEHEFMALQKTWSLISGVENRLSIATAMLRWDFQPSLAVDEAETERAFVRDEFSQDQMIFVKSQVGPQKKDKAYTKVLMRKETSKARHALNELRIHAQDVSVFIRPDIRSLLKDFVQNMHECLVDHEHYNVERDGYRTKEDRQKAEETTKNLYEKFNSLHDLIVPCMGGELTLEDI